MDVEGYPVRSILGELERVSVEPGKRVMREGDDFTENFPPRKGDKLFRLKRGVREAVGFVFDELVPPQTGDSQTWKVEMKRPDEKASAEKAGKELTVEDIRRSMEDPNVKLVGSISPEVLEAFLCVGWGCAFSEDMAQGTDSWLNQGGARLDPRFLQLDLSGVAGLEDAKRILRDSLNSPPLYSMLSGLIQEKISKESDSYTRISLEERYVNIDI